MRYEHVTLCFSLPRSRSHWLAWLYGNAIPTWHDPLATCDHPLELKGMIDAQDYTPLFIADTTAILFHTAITTSLPGANFVYVLRNPNEVCESLKRQTRFPQTSLIQRMNARLLKESEGAANVSRYEDLNQHALRWWPRITGVPLDRVTEAWRRAACSTVVDVPVQQQHGYPEKRHALMFYQEPTHGC